MYQQHTQAGRTAGGKRDQEYVHGWRFSTRNRSMDSSGQAWISIKPGNGHQDSRTACLGIKGSRKH
jgi:hypothetical protein